MIAKGTTHNNGARLASYLVHCKDEDERAELFELRGFADDDIVEAFRSVHVMADATRCEKPFYHCQVRTPDGEDLSREQWLTVADRLERQLGLAEQPRAIAFHTKDGHEHMHIAWSRIDEDTLTAKELSFDHRKLMRACRDIEQEMGLTPVPNERVRTGPEAPSREEYEQARRLGVDIHATRQTIRDCWERADNGASFAAALQEQGLTLARGDRRDYVVMDGEGGVHALGKRVLGISAHELRERLADLDPASVPSLEQARQDLASREHAGLNQPDRLAQAVPSQGVDPMPARADHNQADHAAGCIGVSDAVAYPERAAPGGEHSPTAAPSGHNIGRAASGVADALGNAAEKVMGGGLEVAADLFTLGLGSSPAQPPSPPSQRQEFQAMATSLPKPAEDAPRLDRSVTSNPPHVVMNNADALLNAPRNPSEAPPDLAEQIMAKWRKDRERDRER